MNFEQVEKIAAAILYEGYILYPYRKTAIKNRQRWNFGTLYPNVYAEAQRPAEASRMAAEFLVEADKNAAIDLKVSFLQLVRDREEAATQPAGPAGGPGLADPSLAWEEAAERSAEFHGLKLDELRDGPQARTVQIDAAREPQDSGRAEIELQASLLIRAEEISGGAWKLHLSFENVTPVPSGSAAKREEALPRSFVSAHMLVAVDEGAFVSLLEPPDAFAQAVAGCKQSGIFPVLVGEEGSRSMMFCSPIILYDYPKIAPESEGDFFDGTEMDEMLALRVMTLTDAEKQEMRGGDPRARRILERTEAMTAEAMMKAHGVVRSLRSVPADFCAGPRRGDEFGMQDWNPFEETKAAPEFVRVFGVELRVGDRVRLWPQKRADIMDMALAGKVAMIEAIEQDFEDQVQFAVVMDDDPGREFGMMRQPGHRFFYSPDEVEPVSAEEPG